MESVVIDLPLSGHRSCLHIYDPIKNIYSGAAFCSLCQYINSYLRTRRYCYAVNAPILSLRSFGERFGLGTDVIEERFAKLVSRHDSLTQYDRFYFPGNLDVTHIHGVGAQKRYCHNRELSNADPIKHLVSDWCLSPSVRCNRGQKMELAGVVHTISEGSPSTSYAITCSACSATVWHSGLGGQIIMFDLLHLAKIDWDYGKEVFGISFADGKYFQEILLYTALHLWQVADWAFTESAREIMFHNPSPVLDRPEEKLKLSPGIAKVEGTILRIDTRSDSIGNFVCDRTRKVHSWRISYPAIHLELVFPPEINFLVDHLMYPRIVGRAKKGHAVRAYGLWGIPDYAPRFNQAYLDSVRKRKVLGVELDHILDVDIDPYDSPDSDFGDEGVSGRGEAEMESTHQGVDVFMDEESGEHYYIDAEGEPRWLADATQEELDWIYGNKPVEEDAPPAVVEEEAVLVEEIPTTADVEVVEENPPMVYVDFSVAKTIQSHGERVTLLEESVSSLVERERELKLEEKLKAVNEKLEGLLLECREIPVLKESIRKYRLQVGAVRSSPVSSRGRGQMNAEKVQVQTDKPDSVLPVNPDMIYEASASKAGDHVASVSADLVNMPSSRYLIGNFRWGVVDNEHTVIHTLEFPQCIFDSCPWLKNTSQMFQYFRMNGMELIVTMTSNFTQGGVLFVGWDSISSCKRRKVVTIYELFNLPHGLMVAGKDAELKFNVGFDSIQERLSLAGYEIGLLGLGSLCFSPLNALVCPSQTTQYCEMNVYCKLEDPDFIFRTVIHDYKPKFDLNSLAQVLVDPGDRVDRRAATQGLDMCGKSLIYTGKWASTSQNRLISLAVHPCVIKKIGKFLYPSSLSMISSLYHYWSGSLRYTFIFGGNKLTTGKLHVCAIPGQFVTDPPSSNIIMGTGGRVMNLKDGDTHFEFEVPFYGTGGKQRICRHTLFDAMYYGEDLVARLHVWVVDPLITNIGATSSLSFAVTVEPGSDFKLYDPRGIQPGVTRSLKAQGPVSQAINTKLVKLPGAAYSLFSSWGHIMNGHFRPTKGLRFKVAPMYREQQVDMNVLSWISNYYARWRGTLEYKFVCKPHSKNLHKYVYFWHMYEDPHMEAEYGYEGAYLPPSGVPSLKWDLSSSSEFIVTVPFQSRFNSLYLPLSQLSDVKYQPTHYYNGVVHASYYGTETVGFNVYIRALSDFELFGHGAMTVIAQEGGDVSLPYLSDLTSVEDMPVTRKNEPLQVVRDMFEDYDPEEDDLLDESDDDRNVRGASPTSVLQKPPVVIPPPVVQKEIPKISKPIEKKEEPKDPKNQQSSRGKGHMEDGLIGKWAAKKILGESTAENLAKIDSEKVAKMVNWGCEASKFDFDALSGLVQKLVPLAENLNKRAEEASVFTQEGAKGISFLGELSEMGAKLLEMIKGLYKSSSLGWIAAQYDDGKITLAVIGTLAMFFVGIMWWRYQSSMNWVTKVASIVAILWAPEIGLKSVDLYHWLARKLGETEAKVSSPVMETCREEASSSLQSEISARGVAQMELDFLSGMTDYSEVILSSILMVGSLFCLSILPDDKTINSWTGSLTSLGNKARAFTSIGGLLSMLQNWAKTISECFMGWMVKLRGQKLLGDDEHLSSMMKFGVADWVKRVCDLSLEEEKLKQINDVEKIQEIRELYDKGQKIKMAMLTHNFGAGTAAVFRDTINKAEKLVNETYSSKGLGEPRIDPFHVAFIGAPGVGKTAMVQTYVKNLLDYLKYPQKDRLYARSCADAYWSRYCRQPVVLYDDLGALTGDSSFSDYGEFINLKANTPYPLNMAAVEEKGAMFQSHFIVSTSNAFFMDNNSNVRNPEAFYRRRDIAVCIERAPHTHMNPEDPTEGLLFTIVNTFNGNPRFEWPEWMGIEDGTFSLVRVPYRQFLIFTSKYAKKYLENQKKLMKNFKVNYTGDVDSELEVERMLGELVAQRSASGTSTGPSDGESSGDEDFWGPAVDDPNPFPGAAMMFPANDQPRRRPNRQRNPQDFQRDFEAQMDRFIVEDKPFFTTLELLGLYAKWEISGEHLAKSIQERFGFHLAELYECKSVKMLDHLKCICTCTEKSAPIECDGGILWNEIQACNGLYAPQKNGERAVWLTSQVRGMSARYRVNFVPEEPWQIFVGLIQAVRLYTKHWGCPGQIFNSVDLLSVVDETAEEEDDFVDTYEVFPVSVYDRMQMEDGVSYFDRDDFKGTYPLVCGTFGGIPVKIGGHHIFLGKKENRRPGEVTDEEYAWVRNELTRKSCSRVLESLIPAFSDMDIILMKQAIQGYTGHLCSISEYENCGSLKFVMDRLGWGTYGMVLFYMLLATKEGINKRILKKKKKDREESMRIAEGYSTIIKEQKDKLSTCSDWLRRALVFGGLISAGVVVGLSVWGVWKGITGMFGFVWNMFTPTKEEVKTQPGALEAKTRTWFPPVSAVVKEAVVEPTEVKPAEVSVAAVVQNRYEGKPLEMQAGTYGSSGDQKTAYHRKYTKRIITRSVNMRTKGKAHAECADVGITVTPNGDIDGVSSDAMAHVKMKVGTEFGVAVNVPDVVLRQMDLKSPILETIEAWQRKMISEMRVVRPEYVRKDGVSIEAETKAVVVKGNASFVIERNIDPSWQGCFLSGRGKNDEDLIDKTLLAQMKQNPTEVAYFFDLKATIGDEVERVGLQPESQAIDKNVLALSEVLESSVVQVLTTRSQIRFFGVMVAGTWMLIPAHYLMQTHNDEELIHLSVRGVHRVRLNSDRCFLVSKYQDLALVDLGPRCPLFRDIRSHFVSDSILPNWRRSAGMLMHTCYRRKGMRVNTQYCSAIDLIDTSTEAATTVYDTLGAGDHINVAGFKYPAITGVGWCGSLLISGAPGATKKILGIHTAGHTKFAIGYAEMVTVEALNGVMDHPNLRVHATFGEGQMGLEKILNNDPNPRRDTTRKSKILKELGVVKTKYVPLQNGKTDIKRSQIHGLFGKVQTEPSILRAFDLRLRPSNQVDGVDRYGKWDPLLEAVEKYGEKTHSFPHRKIQQVERFLKHHYSYLSNSVERHDLLTEDECINGIEFNDSYLPLNMDTSPGWPSILEREKGTSGKDYLFEIIESVPNGRKRYKLINEDVRNRIIERESAAKQGQHTFFLTVECSKDERRKKKKIYEEPATRSFTNLDVAQNLLYRKYFLNFGVMVQENFSRSFCKVGINVNGPEWSALIQSWMEKSRLGFAGDYAKFDGIGDPDIFMSICRVVNNWYGDGEENARVREMLLYDAFHRVSLVRNVAVEINQGMPSGFPMTVIFNSIVNFYFLCMAWCDILTESHYSKYASPEGFWELCGVATYGDDNVVSVPPEVLEIYNLRTVAQWLANYGISYTDDQKRPIEESEMWVPIPQVTFLKRGFREIIAPMLVVAAPLDKVSVEEQGHWIRHNNPDGDEYALRQNLNNALYEASLHGKEYFDDLKKRIDTALDFVHLEPTKCTYLDCLKRFWSYHMNDAVCDQDLGAIIEKGFYDSRDKWSDLCFNLNEETVSMEELFKRSKEMKDEFFDLVF